MGVSKPPLFTAREIALPLAVLASLAAVWLGVPSVAGRDVPALAAAILGGLPIFLAGAIAIRKAVRKRSLNELNMGVLTSIAILAAVAAGEDVAAAIVVLMMLAGIALEDAALRRAGQSVGDVMSLVPPTAVRLGDGGTQEEVATESLTAGDLVLVRSGERVAVDGTVEDGQASVNQAPVTGEALAVAKAAGDEVYEGTLVEEGYLHVRAVRVGEDATIAKIRSLVDEARSLRSPFQRTADRFAAYFTPLLILVAGVVWLWSGEVERAITVLVVFCPCSLVVAAPTAVFASVGRAARDGVIIRGGVPLETAARIDTVLLDKTGTLTVGKPSVERVEATGELGADEVLRLAGALEAISEHPLGRAIRTRALERHESLPEVELGRIHPGRGVEGRVEGRHVLVGSRRLMADHGIECPPGSDGRVRVRVAADGEPLGALKLADPLRPGADRVAGELRERGVTRVLLVTGDAEDAARETAGAAGIEEVHAEALPADKVRLVHELRGEGRRVLVVGDGVNDGPALAGADLAVVMGRSGTDVALGLSGATLVDDRIDRLPRILDFGRQAVRVIRGNVWAAMGINAAGVVLGALGLIGPVVGALIHNVASFAVVLNSARLARR
jgi:heavy metal translocating P-type ATPase